MTRPTNILACYSTCTRMKKNTGNKACLPLPQDVKKLESIRLPLPPGSRWQHGRRSRRTGGGTRPSRILEGDANANCLPPDFVIAKFRAAKGGVKLCRELTPYTQCGVTSQLYYRLAEGRRMSESFPRHTAGYLCLLLICFWCASQVFLYRHI